MAQPSHFAAAAGSDVASCQAPRGVGAAKRTTGTLVFLNWSGRGDVSARKLAWYHATRRWDAVRLGSQFAWVVPASVSWKSIRETLEATLVRSDKAIVTFPRRGKAGTMSIHTLNV